MKIPKIKLKTDFVQNIVIGILALLLLLSNFSIVAQFLGKLNPRASYQKEVNELKGRVLLLEFDRVRIEDVSNLLLALQDYNFDTGSFPSSLEELKEKGYLDKNGRLVDPGTNQPYFYQKRENDFILCVWLSDMIKGVNTSECSPTPSESRTKTESPKQENAASPSAESRKQEVEVIGDTIVNVREEPSLDSPIVAKVLSGDRYTSTEIQDEWHHIVVNNEKDGWAHSDFVRVITTE
ncbi:MAG: SH3 domain-containing protein [Patescibacteria group bacterium]